MQDFFEEIDATSPSDQPVSGGLGAVLKRGKRARGWDEVRDAKILAAPPDQFVRLAREFGVSVETIRLRQRRLEAVIAEQMKGQSK